MQKQHCQLVKDAVVMFHFDYYDMLRFQTPQNFIHFATEFASNSWGKAKEQTDEPDHRKKQDTIPWRGGTVVENIGNCSTWSSK